MKLKKVFFGYNLDSSLLKDYSGHIKVTINSCIKNTNLDIYFMYCGHNDELLDWLKSKPITLINVSDFDLINMLPNYYENGQLIIARGAWQRLIIPQVCKKLGIADTHVLYTDVDVIFMQNIEKSIDLNIDKFACALQMPNGCNYNTGVMIINVAYLESIYEPVIDLAKNNFAKHGDFSCGGAYDQGTLNTFIPKDQITILDNREWNCSPCMHDDYKNSRIIHFHGPKAEHINFYLKGGSKEKFKRKSLWPIMELSNKKNLTSILNLYQSFYEK